MAKWKKDKMANNNLQNSEQYELHTKPMLTQMLWKGEQFLHQSRRFPYAQFQFQ
jgi:hypothetical protein